MTKRISSTVIMIVAIAASSALGEKPEKWLDAGDTLAAASEKNAEPSESIKPEEHHERCCPPLPLHNLEGISGAPMTPMAYIGNASCNKQCCGGPVVSYTFLNAGSKEMHVVAITQPLFNRLEFGYAYSHMDLGSLYSDIRDAGMDPGRRNIQLHHFNLRGMLVKENDFGLPLPAITAGVHLKHNHGIRQADRNLGGAISAIGFKHSSGVDFTLTATKMFPTLAFGRPVMLTGGLRLSKAAQIGLLGFGDKYYATFEGSVVYMPTDWLALAYELRSKPDPYKQVPGLIGHESNWQSFAAGWVVNDHMTIAAVFGLMGNVANACEDNSVGIQLRWEF